MTQDADQSRLALVTGATGFVGRQVVLKLVDEGWRVRCLCRSQEKAESMPWAQFIDSGEVEVFVGDATDREDVERALDGVEAAFYLLHSMSSGAGFADEEAEMARQFGEAAAAQDVARIVYLGGLHPDGDAENLSEHLASRVKVGEELGAAGVPVAALQAGVVLGPGSLSFQLLRHVSERVPAFIAPAWIQNQITPISVRDVVHYLVAAADLPSDVSRTFDIGGPDTMPYVDMMQRYTQVVGVRRRPFFTAPIMTRTLASWGLGLLTPLGMKEILPIFDSVASDTVLKERDLEALVGQPEGGNQTFEEAIAEAAEGTDAARYGKLATTIHAAAVVAGVGGTLASLFPSKSYRRLQTPSWQPPAWVFPVIWLPLCIDAAVMSTTSIADSLEDDDRDQAESDTRAFAANLLLGAGWSLVYFRTGARRLATGLSAALAASSADLVRRVYRKSPDRAALLAPYPVWAAFTTALAADVASRNQR